MKNAKYTIREEKSDYSTSECCNPKE